MPDIGPEGWRPTEKPDKRGKKVSGTAVSQPSFLKVILIENTAPSIPQSSFQ